MKLLARLERGKQFLSNTSFIKIVYEPGVRYLPRQEAIITNAIGPRPWAELSMWKDGKEVRAFSK